MWTGAKHYDHEVITRGNHKRSLFAILSATSIDSCTLLGKTSSIALTIKLLM